MFYINIYWGFEKTYGKITEIAGMKEGKNGNNYLRGDKMYKAKLKILIVFLLLGSFAVGYVLTNLFSKENIADVQKKPVNINIEEKKQLVDENTRIVYEREYILSDEKIISDIENMDDLIGKSFKDIKARYSEDNGFIVAFKDNTLTITELVDDWSPQDKTKCRLKEYKGHVGVFRGPDRENDELLRVTNIRFVYLPQSIQDSICKGEYEFKNEEELNDALENLDEYL